MTDQHRVPTLMGQAILASRLWDGIWTPDHHVTDLMEMDYGWGVNRTPFGTSIQVLLCGERDEWYGGEFVTAGWRQIQGVEGVYTHLQGFVGGPNEYYGTRAPLAAYFGGQLLWQLIDAHTLYSTPATLEGRSHRILVRELEHPRPLETRLTASTQLIRLCDDVGLADPDPDMVSEEVGRNRVDKMLAELYGEFSATNQLGLWIEATRSDGYEWQNKTAQAEMEEIWYQGAEAYVRHMLHAVLGREAAKSFEE